MSFVGLDNTIVSIGTADGPRGNTWSKACCINIADVGIVILAIIIATYVQYQWAVVAAAAAVQFVLPRISDCVHAGCECCLLRFALYFTCRWFLAAVIIIIVATTTTTTTGIHYCLFLYTMLVLLSLLLSVPSLFVPTCRLWLILSFIIQSTNENVF